MKSLYRLFLVILSFIDVASANLYKKPIDVEDYTLKPSYYYCKGFGKINEIESIEFSRTPPKSYERQWNAGKSEDSAITGYRTGNKVTIVADKIYLNKNSSYMFAKCSGSGMYMLKDLKEIKGLDLLDTSRCEDMSMMFFFDDFLEELPEIKNWDTGSVKDMSFMFSGCDHLKRLPIDNWNVENVVYFTAIFQGKDDNLGDMILEELDLSQWNTKSAINMSHMFYGCAKLKSLDLSNWNVENVQTFSHMFADCYGLEEVKLDNWRTTSVESFDAMFNDCRKIKQLDLTSFDVSSCHQFSQMFESCYDLENIIGIDKWNVENADTYAFSETFHGCHNLKRLNLSQWKAPRVDDTFRMFKDCKSLAELDLRGLNMKNVVYCEEMLDGCKAIIKMK